MARLITNAPKGIDMLKKDLPNRGTNTKQDLIQEPQMIGGDLHFSNIPSNFGDDTFDQLLPSPFHQNFTRKISDQDYDKCEITPASVQASMAFDDDEDEAPLEEPTPVIMDQFECVDAFIEDQDAYNNAMISLQNSNVSTYSNDESLMEDECN